MSTSMSTQLWHSPYQWLSWLLISFSKGSIPAAYVHKLVLLDCKQFKTTKALNKGIVNLNQSAVKDEQTIYNLLICIKNITEKKMVGLCTIFYRHLSEVHVSMSFTTQTYYVFNACSTIFSQAILAQLIVNSKGFIMKLKKMRIKKTTKSDWILVSMQAMMKQIGPKTTN